jgi:hypothetical protein
MKPEDHNKVLGILHLIYGGIHTPIILGALVLFLLTFAGLDVPAALFVVLAIVVMIIGLLFTLPALIAGYALLKHKPWAKTAAIVAAAVAALNIPFGTALSAYTFWFLFGEGGRMYEQSGVGSGPRGALPDGSPSFEWNMQPASGGRRRGGREPEYVPPTQPPNWRDE